MTDTPIQQPKTDPTGVAPADARAHKRWPQWKIALAYSVLFGVAMGSIWMIDDHVLQASPAATRPR